MMRLRNLAVLALAACVGLWLWPSRATLAGAAVVEGAGGSGGGTGGGKLQFNRDIRPILSNNCFQCHGPDEKKRKGGLRLDTLEGALADHEGRHAIVSGKPAASELVRRIFTDEDEDHMPPAKSEKKLNDAQRELLKRWVEEGAAYQKHWAFEAIGEIAPPVVKEQGGWARNEIDGFILAKLEEAGLRPSAEAAKETLIRRVYLDLIGLPPTPAEVAAFVADGSAGAYEKVVDRLLANVHYGERWGRHWLDQARYADSNGYSIDSARSMWPYRDWVIKAINEDMPFDRFTIEQLAGDLLPSPTESQLIATGFHRNTMINQEGGTDPEQFRVEAAIDRANTTGAVWLGLTVGCAQCHTHKFDPITQKEFYQLYAFFNSDADRNGAEPTLKLAGAEQKQKLAELKKQLAEAKKAGGAGKGPAIKGAPGGAAKDAEGVGAGAKWVVVTPGAFNAKSGVELTKLEDQSLLAGGKNPDEELYTVTAKPPLKKVTAIRLETLTHESLPKKGPGRAGNGNFVLHEIRVTDSNAVNHEFSEAVADVSQNGYPIENAIDGKLETGWAINPGAKNGPMNVNRTAVFVFKNPVMLEGEERLTIELQSAPGPKGYAIGRFRISVTDDPQGGLGAKDSANVAGGAASGTTGGASTGGATTGGATTGGATTGAATTGGAIPGSTASGKSVKELEAAIKLLESQSSSTMVMKRLPEARPSFIHIRGDFLRHGDPVTPGTLAVLHPFKPRSNQVKGQSDIEPADPARNSQLATRNSDAIADRLDLARWLMDPANPLTPRVTVNRVWMHYFGKGFVETENDFGTQGSTPTHPELLDWLAREFVKKGWSMKALHKLIVMSATYRQASTIRAELSAADPLNRLLARQNRLRVEAEIVRDVSLSASGLLVEKIGGPSVYPPQPEGVFAFTQTKQKWPTSMGEDRYRRGMYTFVFRSSPYPMLTTFDVPRPDVTCTRRVRSNTPLQSLTLANGAPSVEMAQALARRVVVEAKDDEARVARMFEGCLARRPGEGEMRTMLGFVKAQSDEFAKDADAAKKLAGKADGDVARLAAWTAAARVVMNLDEFITRE